MSQQTPLEEIGNYLSRPLHGAEHAIAADFFKNTMALPGFNDENGEAVIAVITAMYCQHRQGTGDLFVLTRLHNTVAEMMVRNNFALRTGEDFDKMAKTEIEAGRVQRWR